MNKITILFLFAFFTWITQDSKAQTVDQILQNHFEASGQEKLSNVRSVRSSGKAIQMGTELPFLQVQKRPDQIYLELDIQGDRMIQAYNGREGWSVEPWLGSEPRELKGPELNNLKQMAGVDSDLVGWREKGHELDFVGRESSGSSEYLILELTKEKDEIYRFYIDSGSWLIHKMAMYSGFEGNNVEGETIMSDYRRVGGISLPFRIEIRYGGETLMTNIIDEVEFDGISEENYFTSPL